MSIDEDVPSAFLCPLSKNILIDPVATLDGHVFERTEIENWLRVNGPRAISPVTGIPLESIDLISIPSVSAAIQDYLITRWNAINFCCGIKFSSLTISLTIVGIGSNKTVYKGRWKNKDVAILEMRKGIFREINVLRFLKPHRNIVCFFGLCVNYKKHFMVAEFAPLSSLDLVLENNQKAGKTPISNDVAFSIFDQISSGMEMVASLGITHRDLATRNILVMTFDEKDTSKVHVKVSDFGLSTRGRITVTTDDNLPIRWTAPECFVSHCNCCEKSDIWSFGVLIWEVLSSKDLEATIPYVEYSDEEKLKLLLLAKNVSLRRPKSANDGVWDVVNLCMKRNPQNRPTFSNLSVIIKKKQLEQYIIDKEIEIRVDERSLIIVKERLPLDQMVLKPQARELLPDKNTICALENRVTSLQNQLRFATWGKFGIRRRRGKVLFQSSFPGTRLYSETKTRHFFASLTCIDRCKFFVERYIIFPACFILIAFFVLHLPHFLEVHLQPSRSTLHHVLEMHINQNFDKFFRTIGRFFQPSENVLVKFPIQSFVWVTTHRPRLAVVLNYNLKFDDYDVQLYMPSFQEMSAARKIHLAVLQHKTESELRLVHPYLQAVLHSNKRIIRLLEHSGQDRSLASQCCLVIAEKSRDAHDREDIVIRLKGVKHVITSINSHGFGNPVFMRWALLAISNLCDKKTIIKITENETIYVVSSAIKEHFQYPKVVSVSCVAIGNFAYNSEARETIASYGALETISSAVSVHMNSIEVQHRCAYAIGKLSRENRINKNIFVSAGVLRSIAFSMHSYLINEGIQYRSAYALTYLAWDNSRAQEQILRSGLLQLVISAMKYHNQSTQVLIQCCRALNAIVHRNGNAKLAAIQHDALSPITMALARFASSEKIQTSCQGTLQKILPS